MFDDIIDMYKDVEFEHRDMRDCLVKLMECVEMMPKLAGADKKKVVKGVLVLIVNHVHINEKEKNRIIYMLTNDIIDMIIDLIIELSKNTPKLNLHIHRPNFGAIHIPVFDDTKQVEKVAEKTVESSEKADVQSAKVGYCHIL
jgi:hypothetical protein